MTLVRWGCHFSCCDYATRPPPAVMGSLVRSGYFLGFYFWIDAIATSSLLFEVPSVRASILGIG